jgi:hypothetical protein
MPIPPPKAPATPGFSAPAVQSPQYPPVPQQLLKIQARAAAQIAQHTHPSPNAEQLLAAKPNQTPSQYLSTLQDHRMGHEMVKTLAHGMPDREGVHWATQSVDKVLVHLPPHELQVNQAAQAWVKNPTPANQAAAASAAAKGGCRGPGSLAAQAAAWAKPPVPTAPNPPASVGGAAPPRLTPQAVSGSVLMSAAIKANPAVAVPAVAAPAVKAPMLQAPALQAPQLAAPAQPAVVPPAVAAQTFQEQHPFIAMGLDIASGKTQPG